MLYANEKIYGDGFSSTAELVGDGTVVHVNGEPRYLTRKPRTAPYGSLGPTFESSLKAFSREEIKNRAIHLANTESRISDMVDFEGKDQNGTNYCWIFGCIGAFEFVRRKQGNPHQPLSPASAGGPITGYRNVGGWGEDGHRRLKEVGVCRTVLWPDTAISAKYLTAEVQQDYANHKIVESYDGQSNNVEQLWTLLLLGIPCPLGLDWWGHLIWACDVVVLPDGTLGTRIRNSWNDAWGSKNKHGRGGFSVLTEAKSRGDFFGIGSVTNSAL